MASASLPSSAQFAEYTYSGLLANAATFVPQAKTIIQSVIVSGLVPSASQLQLRYGTIILSKNSGASHLDFATLPLFYSDGTHIGIYNGANQITLKLFGIIMSE